MTDPLPISVVIPAYNREILLERSLRSVERQQPRPPLEVIVVDDCSSDRTAAVAERFGARVIRHSRNRGEGEARNSGIAAARGEWIALLDSDDEWLPNHLDLLWGRRSGLVVVADSALACGPNESDDRIHGAPTRRALRLDEPSALVWPENPVPASGGMIAAGVARAAGGYRPLPRCADLDFLLRCLEHGPGAVYPDVSLLYHVHEEQVSADREEMQTAHTRVCAEYSQRPWWSRAAFERWRAAVAWDRFREARADGAPGAAGRLLPLLASPQRLLGLARLWAWRLRLRRRSGRVGRDGRPSLALLSGHGPPSGWRGTRIVDLQGISRAAALVRLGRRPTAAAVVEGPPLRLAVRLLGIEPVSGGG